ncbi:MAG: hypothetical protein PWR07_878 [Bacillota bacterium]|nr:hypothetical protein [Bacillota bacterium]MDI6638454.1 hypothetical protein [Bacillota bacterium]MDK2930747.1 hypothetical protein [Bacillota bacterium]
MGEDNGYTRRSVTRSLWEKRQRQWARYHAWEWEESRPETQPEWDPAARVRWYGQAWDLARRFKPEWTSDAIDWDKIRRIGKWREAVARLGRPGSA